jgi:hypothetical protein
MSVPEFLELRAGYGYFRPVGKVTLAQATQLLTRALDYAVQEKIPRMLVNACELVMPLPTLADRYFAVREWASVAGGCVRLALVLPAEVIDPQRFGEIVARNAGLTAHISASEPEALHWLLADKS